jgi:hypothetical protein
MNQSNSIFDKAQVTYGLRIRNSAIWDLLEATDSLRQIEEKLAANPHDLDLLETRCLCMEIQADLAETMSHIDETLGIDAD